MRYLNTTTLRQETKSNSNNIIDSDARVSNWFKPCPEGYFGEWVGDTYTFTLIPLPTKAELDAEALAKSEYDALQYARNRATEYSALNQFEMQFDDQRDGTTTWVDAINDIKARHPKS